MITVDFGKNIIELDGDLSVIFADIACAMMSLADAIADEKGEETAFGALDEQVKLVKRNLKMFRELKKTGALDLEEADNG